MSKRRCISFIIATLLAMTCLVTTSCGDSVTYSADVAVAELADAVDALLENPSDFATMSDDYIIGMMEIDPTEFVEHTVKLRASGANIDEYGIFKVKDEAEASAALETVKAYLARRVEAWMPEYMPEEFPKMEAASVKVMGRYIIYAILADDVKAEVFDAIEDKLIEK